MTEEAFPAIFPYLTRRDIFLFDNESEYRQQSLLHEWKSSKQFLSHVPTRGLPPHFLPSPNGRPAVTFHYGWRLSHNTLYKVARRAYPEQVALSRFVPFLSKQLEVPIVLILGAYCGPRATDRKEFVAICNNHSTLEQRTKLLESRGAQRLKELIKLKDPVWVVDTDTFQWPQSFEEPSEVYPPFEG
ncbi:hypothetical protein BT96DRAFT_927505 [Gymnopus androsaceus JB14]|uniref:Uncharacterized protein n=1 Tax=Gymnopus androsaceus JB14 TaxID=1447944 RepID=A0A6A4GQU8_9AGAR|nr:hypothetical protein BT96DRAFT_927505 [Gymnopus androsaceus JB14]